jgi:hypothetical protein
MVVSFLRPVGPVPKYVRLALPPANQRSSACLNWSPSIGLLRK